MPSGDRPASLTVAWVRTLPADVRARLEREATLCLGEPGAGSPGAAGLGRYRDVRQIAAGGMGAILRAVDPDLGRPVAIKVLRSGCEAEPDLVARFLREARVTGQLAHPGVPPVHELGATDDGRLYLVMKLIDGQSLADRLADLRRRSPGERLAGRGALLVAFCRVCEAVAYAHSREVVHRDLKPANLMIGAFGEVLVLDWGLARIAGEGADAARTQEGTILGTPAYMPPEQTVGDLVGTGPRSDVYSLGAVLYQILTLEPPYVGRDLDALLASIRAGEVERPSRRAPDESIGPELDAIVARAMATRAADRYPDADSLRRDVEAFRTGREVSVLRLPPWRRAARWVRRNLAVSVVGGASLVVIGGFVVGLAVALVEARAARAEAAAAVDDLGDAGLLDDLESRRLDAWRGFPDRTEGLVAWMADGRTLLDRRDRHVERAAWLEAALEHPGPTDDRRRLGWRLGQRRAILGRLERVATERGRMARRIEETAPLRAAGSDRAWGEARAAGLDLQPIAGLAPIGRDPASGLWEFWHVESGSRPERGPGGRLRPTEETGLVLVLLPAGVYLMGDEGSPLADERPAREVRMASFLLSKYEMTQGQWRRLTGSNPSLLSADAPRAGGFSDRHPVEGVGWTDCREALVAYGLDLPSEAGWEYACRAGTTAAWSSGPEAADLVGHANLADRRIAERIGSVEPWDDGFPYHAPVGSFAPNPFGLHDVHGNVWEWCLDVYRPDHAGAPADGGPVLEGPGSLRVVRGGSWNVRASFARSARRLRYGEDKRDSDVGVRPARLP